MKKKLLILLGVLSMGLNELSAQGTATVGFGTSLPANTTYSPIYRFASNSSTTLGRGVSMYTEAELLAAGLSVGDYIMTVAFNKGNTGYFTTPATFTMFLGTSTDTAVNTSQSWDFVTSTMTQVYSTTTLTLSPNTGWETFNISPYLYTGGSLVVASVVNMGGSGAATDAIKFYFTPGHAHKTMGNTIATTTGAIGTGVTGYKQRPNIQLTYGSLPSCSGLPSTPVITASTDSVCNTESFSISNSTPPQALSGIVYQWQESTNGLVWTNIANATSFSGYIGTTAVNNNYRLLAVCTATNDTVISNAEFIAVKNFKDCYCPSSANNASNADIITLTYGGISTPVSTTCGTYTNGTSTIFNGFKNVPTEFSALIDICTGTSTATTTTKVYIDFNQNGSYGDAGEEFLIGSTAPGNTISSFITIPSSALNGLTGMRVVMEQVATASGVVDCGTYTYGETEDYLIQIQNQPTDEVQLVAIVDPKVTQCSFGSSVTVALKNNGLTNLTTAEFDLIFNGLMIPNVAWTGSIAPGVTDTIIIPGTYAFNDGDSLTVTVKNPNGNADIPSDNTRKIKHNIALNGTYSVGYGITDVPNKLFATIQDAVSELFIRGICTDTVYFNVKDGVYNNTQLSLIGNYVNYQPGQWVVIQSESKDANNLQIDFAGTGTTNNYVLNFKNTHGFILKHLTVQATGTTYRTAILFDDNTSHIVIDSCRFIATGGSTGVTSYSANNAAIRDESSSEESNISITNSYFEEFGVGVYFYGASSGYQSNMVVKNNHFAKIFCVGAYSYYVTDFEFTNNIVEMDTVAPFVTTAYMMYFSNTNGALVTGNKFIAKSANQGIYFSASTIPGTSKFLIANNFFFNGENGTGNVSAIRSTTASNSGIEVINNSMYFRGNTTSYGIFHITNGANFSFLNNNVVSEGSMKVFHVTSSVGIGVSENNNFFHNGPTLGLHETTNYATLSDWSLGTGFDNNSLALDPGFVNEDLHTCLAGLDGAGAEYSFITHDIDGDIRSSSPDIGADEFVGSAANLIAADSISKCFGTNVNIGFAGMSNVTYLWNDAGQTTPNISVVNPGQYILNVVSGCGSFADTVQVVDLPSAVADFSLANSYGLVALPTNNSQGALSYHWNFGDGSTSTDANPYHKYSGSGLYLITLTVYGPCDSVVKTEVYNAVALDNEEMAFGKISIYPNPTVETLHIQFDPSQNLIFDIDVLDMTGKKVLHKNNVSGNVFSLDVHSLQTGMYQIRIHNKGMMKVFPFVKK